MHLLYADETNLEERDDDFFIYGALAFPTENASRLSELIENIRIQFSVNQKFLLKFNPGPDHLSHADFIQLKQAVVEAAIECEASFFSELILHQVATNPEEARRNLINQVLYNFDCYLNQAGSHGLVLIDRFSDRQIDETLRERFAIGVKGLPYSPEYRLSRILGLHYSAIGQSHFSTVVDIVLGSFRFAVNAFSRQQSSHYPSARRIISLIQPLFLRSTGSKKILEISLGFLPRQVRAASYRAKYEAVHKFLTECGAEPAQQIVAQRYY